MAELCVHLPDLHPGQLRVRASRAKRKVLILGRRWGKTTICGDESVERMMAGQRVLYGTPLADQNDAYWSFVTKALSEFIDAGHVYKNETKRILEGRLPGWGRIRARTAHDADSLRSDYADLLMLDEWPLMDPSAWTEVGAPMMLDTNGDAWFVGTPKRKNHGYVFFARGLGDETGRWESFTGPSHENPHLSVDALADLSADMTETMIEQEIYAKFLQNDGAVFRNIAACLYPGGESPADHVGHWIVAGQDWGKLNDYSASSICCATCHKELEIVRFRGEDYALQRKRLATVWHRWGVQHIEAESNAMGEPIIEELVREGWPVVGFATTAQSKTPLIESLALSLEREEMQWIDEPVATAELEAYESKANPITGRTTYSAPVGVHDDTVMARALANRAVNAGVLTVGSMYG